MRIIFPIGKGNGDLRSLLANDFGISEMKGYQPYLIVTNPDTLALCAQVQVDSKRLKTVLIEMNALTLTRKVVESNSSDDLDVVARRYMNGIALKYRAMWGKEYGIQEYRQSLTMGAIEDCAPVLYVVHSFIKRDWDSINRDLKVNLEAPGCCLRAVRQGNQIGLYYSSGHNNQQFGCFHDWILDVLSEYTDYLDSLN